MDKKEIRRKLWHSLDMVNLRRSMILVAVVLLLFAPVYRGESLVGLVFLGSIFVILEGVCLWQIWKIYHRPESYAFSQCKLEVFHSKRWTRFFYFTVVAEDQDGHQIPVDTEPIFESWGILGVYLEDYMDRTVTIGYNDQTYSVVVIE